MWIRINDTNYKFTDPSDKIIINLWLHLNKWRTYGDLGGLDTKAYQLKASTVSEAKKEALLTVKEDLGRWYRKLKKAIKGIQ